jgi:hypothetical protein
MLSFWIATLVLMTNALRFAKVDRLRDTELWNVSFLPVAMTQAVGDALENRRAVGTADPVSWSKQAANDSALQRSRPGGDILILRS